jgi:hypothetical protein
VENGVFLLTAIQCTDRNCRDCFDDIPSFILGCIPLETELPPAAGGALSPATVRLAAGVIQKHSLFSVLCSNRSGHYSDSHPAQPLLVNG